LGEVHARLRLGLVAHARSHRHGPAEDLDALPDRGPLHYRRQAAHPGLGRVRCRACLPPATTAPGARRPLLGQVDVHVLGAATAAGQGRGEQQRPDPAAAPSPGPLPRVGILLRVAVGPLPGAAAAAGRLQAQPHGRACLPRRARRAAHRPLPPPRPCAVDPGRCFHHHSRT